MATINGDAVVTMLATSRPSSLQYQIDIDSKEYVIVADSEPAKDSRGEFNRMLQKQEGWWLSLLHKGLPVTLLFLVLAVVGFVSVEVLFSDIGVTSRGKHLTDSIKNTTCFQNVALCYSMRLLRALGVYGLAAGITTWMGVEMLFVRTRFCIGSGVFLRQYKEIRKCLSLIILDHLFDVDALQSYLLSSDESSITKALNLEGKLKKMWQPEIISNLIDEEVEKLKGKREGTMLLMMDVDFGELKLLLKPQLLQLIEELTPVVRKSVSQEEIIDVVGIKQQVDLIIRRKMDEISPKQIKQILALMIRRDLSWIIVYSCIFGGFIGLIVEMMSILIN